MVPGRNHRGNHRRVLPTPRQAGFVGGVRLSVPRVSVMFVPAEVLGGLRVPVAVPVGHPDRPLLCRDAHVRAGRERLGHARQARDTHGRAAGGGQERRDLRVLLAEVLLDGFPGRTGLHGQDLREAGPDPPVRWPSAKISSRRITPSRRL